MTLLMLAGPTDLWGQDCIDFEDIDETLEQLPDACGCTTTLVLGEAGETIDLSRYQLGIVVSNECIEILGTLVIDQVIHFLNCDIKMGDGALIKVNDWVEEITIRGCNIQTCGDNLWDGIELGYFNTIYFLGNIMQHSLNGIHGDYGPVTGLFYDNIFNDNRYSIALGDISHFQQLSQVTAVGNIFAQYNDLKEHWDTGPLHPIVALSYAIQTKNAVFNADASSNPCQYRNIFYKVVHGCILTNTTATIKSNLFHDFRLEIDHGAGIAMGKVGKGHSRLEQNGWPTSHIPTFKGVYFPVQTFETNTKVQDNIIEGAGQAIRVVNARINNIITDNTIEAGYMGISVYNNNARNLVIEHNSILVDATATYRPYSAGIEVMNYRNPRLPGSIRFNQIRSEPSDFGILLVNTRELYTSCNTIHHFSADEDYASGIEVRGGLLNKLVDNKSNGYYNFTSVDEGNGIKIIESSELELRWNRMNDTPFGLHFSGTSTNSEQIVNVFNSNHIGYFIDVSGVTGIQNNPLNKWVGTFTDIGAKNEGIVDANLYREHQNLTTSACWPPSRNPFEWFEPTSTTGSCPTIPITECWKPGDGGTGPMFTTPLDTLIARGELDFQDFPDRRTWQAEMYLYQKLIENSYLVETGSPFDTFMTQISINPVPMYYFLMDSISRVVTPLESWSTEAEDLDSLFAEKSQDYILAFFNWADHPDSLDLLDIVVDLFDEKDSLFSMSADQMHSWDTEIMVKLNSMESDVQSLSAPNLYASNLKSALLAMVQSYPGPDSLSSGLISSLTTIAEGCMLEQGPAHFNATAILNQLDNPVLSFEAYCPDPSNERRVPMQEEDSKFELFVAPNPTSGEIEISFPHLLKAGGRIKLTDISGKVLMTKPIAPNTHREKMNMGHLQNGTYYLLFEYLGGIYSKPVIILK